MLSISAKAQDAARVLQGTVKDTKKMPLHNAGITIVNKDTVIVSFALANAKGDFSVLVPVGYSDQALWLEVSYIGYYKKRIALQPDKNRYELELLPDPNVLSEVIVRNKPVLEQMGDTLRYIVSSFAKSEDRSIGDVLRRMPGIAVGEDGAISHNGKLIENLYIHGDDLMSGKYGTATKVIKKEMIQSVDVIQHHQPIKVLQNKIFSDKTAINLVLKNENDIKLTGTVKLGLGIPSLYDLGSNAILLNKVFKAVNTIGINNAGVDYGGDTKSLGSANMMRNIGTPPVMVDLSLSSVGNPGVPKAYYYRNKSGIINLNNLYNLKTGLQLKLNAQGFIDKNNLDYVNTVQNFVQNDTITFFDRQKLTNKPSSVSVSFNMQSNKKNYFFNNNTGYSYSQNLSNSFMYFNQTRFHQNLYNKLYSIANDFNFMPAVGKKGVFEFRWLLSASNYSNTLQLLDSFYSTIAKHEGYYDLVQQKVFGPETQSKAYMSYKLVRKKGTFEMETGWQYIHQKMNSLLSFTDDGNHVPYVGDSGNDLKFIKNNFYLQNRYDIRWGALSGTIGVPLTLQIVRYDEPEYLLHKSKQNIMAEPNLNLNYKLAQEQTLALTYNYNNSFGNYTQLYRGVILTNYRALQSNDADLQQTKTQTAALNYNYGKSIKLFFFNAGITYLKIKNNSMLSTTVENDVVKTILIPMDNNQTITGASAGASKFLVFAKINASINLGVNKSSMTQLLNEKLINFDNYSCLGALKFNKRFSQLFAIDYNTSVHYTILKNDNIKQTGYGITNGAALSVVGIKKMLIDFSAKHAYNKQSRAAAIDYFFADATVRYTPKNKKLDFTVLMQNLFDVKTYRVNSLSTYQFTNSEYQLRGRTLLLKLDYFL